MEPDMEAPFTPEQVRKALMKARRELGLRTLVRPRVEAVYYEAESDFLLVVVPDRPDKSVLLGPSGRVMKMAKKELGVSAMAVRSRTDLMVKRWRVRQALAKARRLLAKAGGPLREALKRVAALLEAEARYPPRDWPAFEPLEEPAVVVGFSGGVDSTALLYLATRLGLRPIAATVDAGGWMLPPHARERLEAIVARLGVEHAYVRGNEQVFRRVLLWARQGRRHPCRMCHEQIEEAVISYALERGVPIVAFGDLLPTGRYSIYWLRRGGRRLLRLNLMASLALCKSDTRVLARLAGHPVEKLRFGCPLLGVVHREHEEMRLASIQRVLRETRAGVLEPNQALELVKSIIR